jgi:hypothetical protein
VSTTELFANQPFTTVISGGTDLTSTSWTVSSSAPFPTAQTGISQFHVTDTDTTAASEIILVTNADPVMNIWTVVRGAEGTEPVAHQAGFTVTQVLTAGWLNDVTGSNLPATSAGALLYGSPAAETAWLAGPTASTKEFLTSTGAGGTAQTPVWGTIATADVPTLNQNTTGTAGNVTGTVTVLNGGTGGTSATAYAVITGGTAATSPLQHVAGLGSSGQVLTSGGAGTLPQWSPVAGADIGLAPSGDTSGTADTAAIQALLGSTGSVAYLQDGTFYTNAPIVVPAGSILKGTKGATTSVYDCEPPVYGTIIKPVAAWSAGAGNPAVISLNGEGVHIRDLFIDGTNLYGNAISAAGISDQVDSKSVYMQNVGLYLIYGNGIYMQYSSAWHLFMVTVNCAWLNGFWGAFVDSILLQCHAQTAGLAGTGGSGFYLNGGVQTKLIACRGDLSQYGFTVTAGNGTSNGNACQLVGCGTQRNNANGYRINGFSGTAGRVPILISGCASVGDGINGTITDSGNITGGVGGGGYSGILVSNNVIVTVSGFECSVSTSDVSGGCPQYAVTTALNNSLAPALVQLSDSYLNGVTALVNDAAPALSFLYGSNVSGYVGAPFPGSVATLRVEPSPGAPGTFLCPPAEYAPASQTVLSVASTSYATFGYSTTVASGSNGGTISGVASWATPGAGTLAVASTTNFPASGTVTVIASGSTTAVVTYGGTTSTTLTGCAYVSGSGAGTVTTGVNVALSGAVSLLSTGSFAAPASGKVLVEIFANIQTSASPGRIALALAGTGTVTPLAGHGVVETDSTSGTPRQLSERFLVTGLSAGTSYQFDLLGSCSAGQAVTVIAYGQTTTSPTQSGSSVIITVQAV